MAFCGSNSFDDELVILDTLEVNREDTFTRSSGLSMEVIEASGEPNAKSLGNNMDHIDDYKYSQKDSIIKMNLETENNKFRGSSLVNISDLEDYSDRNDSIINLEPEANLLVMLSYEEVFDIIRKASSPPLRSPPILLYGAPGTGKTVLIEKAVAKNGKSITVFTLGANELRGAAEKDTLKLLGDIFEKAISSAPSVVFLDDVDLVPSSASKLLTVNRKGVQIFAATNEPHLMEHNMLDSFVDKHHLSLPSIETINAIFKDKFGELARYFNKKDYERAIKNLGTAKLSLREVKTLLQETLSSNRPTLTVFDGILEKLKSNIDQKYFMIMHNWSARFTH